VAIARLHLCTYVNNQSTNPVYKSMEEKNGDNEEKRENERIKTQQFRSYNHRRFSNQTNDRNYQVSACSLVVRVSLKQISE